MPRAANKSKKHRMSLEFSDKVYSKLNKIKALSDAGSHTEVIRRALAVYELLLDENAEGNKVMVRTDKGDREIIFI